MFYFFSLRSSSFKIVLTIKQWLVSWLLFWFWYYKTNTKQIKHLTILLNLISHNLYQHSFSPFWTQQSRETAVAINISSSSYYNSESIDDMMLLFQFSLQFWNTTLYWQNPLCLIIFLSFCLVVQWNTETHILFYNKCSF